MGMEREKGWETAEKGRRRQEGQEMDNESGKERVQKPDVPMGKVETVHERRGASQSSVGRQSDGPSIAPYSKHSSASALSCWPLQADRHSQRP